MSSGAGASAARYAASGMDHVGWFGELAEAGVAEVVVRVPGLTDGARLATLGKVISAFRP
jgi:hypothetical protein